MVSPEERRRFQRADIKWPVTIETSQGPVKRKTANLSAVGAFIPSGRPSGLGRKFKVIIEVPYLNRRVEAAAQVAWATIYSPSDEIAPRGMGIRFVDISEEDQRLINKSVLRYLQLEKTKPENLNSFSRLVLEPEDCN